MSSATVPYQCLSIDTNSYLPSFSPDITLKLINVAIATQPYLPLSHKEQSKPLYFGYFFSNVGSRAYSIRAEATPNFLYLSPNPHLPQRPALDFNTVSFIGTFYPPPSPPKHSCPLKSQEIPSAGAGRRDFWGPTLIFLSYKYVTAHYDNALS